MVYTGVSLDDFLGFRHLTFSIAEYSGIVSEAATGSKKKFHIFHRKTPVLESLFDKITIKKETQFFKRLQHNCFLVKFAKIFIRICSS